MRGFNYDAVKDYWSVAYPDQTLFHFDIAVIPMNPLENHWYLVAVFIKDKRIECTMQKVAQCVCVEKL